MPIYAFTCSACDHQFDRLQKLSDPDPSACPKCGVEAIKRQLTAPSFRLAGSGWYETDFKKDGDKKRNLSDKADAPAAGAEAKTEVKTDAPAAGKPSDGKPSDGKSPQVKADATPKAPAKAESPAPGKPATGTG